DDAPGRASHGVRDGHLRPRRGARFRQEDRRGQPGRGAAQSCGYRSVPRGRLMAALLELENVHAGYGPTSVLHGVSLSVPEGGVVSLLGANGAGKTTTLRAITGGVGWSGDIRFAGPGADRRPLDLRDRPQHQSDEQGRGAFGRAERSHRARHVEHRLRARGRSGSGAGRRQRAAGQRVGAPLLPRLLADMQEFLQLVVSGIATGGIFASLALALVLIYNAMGLVNFAQGEMAMLATFVAYSLVNRGMSFWIAFPVTLVLAFGG